MNEVRGIMAPSVSKRSWPKTALISLLLVAAGLAACAQIIGADEPQLNPTEGGGASNATSSGQAGSPSSSSTGGGASTSSAGGQGGASTSTTASSSTGATCSDGVKNGDEGDTDCGGSCPLKCVVQQSCNVNGDCATQCCMATAMGMQCCLDANGCMASCNNSCQDIMEDQIDCGNDCNAMSSCANGLNCDDNNDCQSNRCQAGTCLLCTANDCVAISKSCVMGICQ